MSQNTMSDRQSPSCGAVELDRARPDFVFFGWAMEATAETFLF
jgi:hypothetical protein